MSIKFDGVVLERGGPDYEAVRRQMVWNEVKPDRYPEAIVRVASTADIVAGVRLAEERGLRVAVRSGGHSWVGSSVRDGTVLLDMSARRAITVDPDAMTATVEPAVTNAAAADALTPMGLTFPFGHDPPVGLGGYLLSGGLGWNSRAWGPACASVVGVDIVTAAGEMIHATDRDNPEVLWAARGAGPGFPGVVTRFHLRLRPLPRAITASVYLHSVDDLDAVTTWVSQIAEELSPTVEHTTLLGQAGPFFKPDPGRTALFVQAVSFADSPEAAHRDLAPFTSNPCRDQALRFAELQPTTYAALFRGTRHHAGLRFGADNLWTDGDHADVMEVLLPAALDAPSPRSLVHALMYPTGASDADRPDMAFSAQGRTYVGAYAIWDDPDEDDANFAWLKRTSSTIQPAALGHYVAETDLTAAASRARRSYTPENWARLDRFRRSVDPDGRFSSYVSGAAGETHIA